MAYYISPGVYSTELDFTPTVPSVSTTDAAIAGVFSWGPCDDRELVTSEEELVLRYGYPTASNYETFYSAANFLGYGNKLYVSRASSTNAYNATAGNGAQANTQILNKIDYEVTPVGANTYYSAKYPGTLGNSLKISICDSAAAFSSNIAAPGGIYYALAFSVQSNVATITVTDGTANNVSASNTANSVVNSLQVGDYLTAGNSSLGYQQIQIGSIGSPSSAANGVVTVNVNLKTKYYLSSNVTSNNIQRSWEYYNVVDRAPGTSTFAAARGGSGDELHVVVVDEDGAFTRTPGTILEVFETVSRATDSRGEQGGSNFYKEVLNTGSQYIWWSNARAGVPSALASAMTPLTTQPLTLSFSGGTDTTTETALSLADAARAYDQFKSKEEVDISVIMTGKSIGGTRGEGLARYLIDNIVEKRQDCVLVVSPRVDDVVNAPNQEVENIVAFRNALGSSSYAILDSGYKLQYDRYNDTKRWVPLNGDIAGLIARTDSIRDPWFSPAGQNRGIIKNVERLAYNPSTEAVRDILYKSDINPVVTFRTLGTMLYGDKTILGRQSAFDRINVRRLFIVLRKAISLAAQGTLFELNNEFTRANFRNMVEPFLRDVQGRQGIYGFRVICDETNNTPQVIDRNEFKGDILIKPARSINFVKLTFAALGTGVAFEEYVDQL